MSRVDKVFSVALTRCFYCGESSDIILNRTLTTTYAKAVQAMDGKVVNMSPCQNCAEHMKKGIILITIDPKKSEPGWNLAKLPNPYRTGGFFVVTENAIEKIIVDGELLNWIKKSRWTFIDHVAAESLGLFEYAKQNKDKKDKLDKLPDSQSSEQTRLDTEGSGVQKLDE